MDVLNRGAARFIRRIRKEISTISAIVREARQKEIHGLRIGTSCTLGVGEGLEAASAIVRGLRESRENALIEIGPSDGRRIFRRIETGADDDAGIRVMRH